MKILKSILPILIFLGTQTLPAQNAAPQAGIKIDSFEVEKAKLPGSEREWSKLICNFTNSVGWVDGLSFNYSALVESEEGKTQVVTGGLTYVNVPKGANKAIMYMSPLATARYGAPVSVNIEIFRGDLPIQSFKWGKNQNENWFSKYSTQAGVLKSVQATPWVVYDADLCADFSAY